MNAIGQTLKLLRIRADLSQQDLAARLGVTANYLSLVEHGHREPNIRFLRTFQATLHVPLGLYLWLALDQARSDEEEV